MEYGLSPTSQHHNKSIARPTSLPGLNAGINDQFNNLNISPEANNVFSHKPLRNNYENVSPMKENTYEIIIGDSEQKWRIPGMLESVTQVQEIIIDDSEQKLRLPGMQESVSQVQTSHTHFPGPSRDTLGPKPLSNSGYSSSQSSPRRECVSPLRDTLGPRLLSNSGYSSCQTSPRSECVSPFNIVYSGQLEQIENIDKCETFEKHPSSKTKIMFDSNESNSLHSTSSSDESEDSSSHLTSSNNVNVNSHSYIKELNTGYSENLICEMNNNVISRSLSPPPIPPRSPNPPVLPPKSPTPPALPPRNPGPSRLTLGPKPIRKSSDPIRNSPVGTSTMLSPNSLKTLQPMRLQGSLRRHSSTTLTQNSEEKPPSPCDIIIRAPSKGKRSTPSLHSLGQESLTGPSLLGIEDLVQLNPNPQIEISIEAQNLGVRDVLHKSCPRCVVFLQNSQGQYQELEQGRTEIIMNNNTDHWVKKVIVPQRPLQRQYLKFVVYDWVQLHSETLADQVQLGHIVCDLQDIVNMEGLPLTKPVYDGRGTLKISCEVMSPTKEMFILQFAGKNLEKMDLMSISDPFIIIYRASGKTSHHIPVYKSKVILNNYNPVWEEFKITSQLLANGDYSRSIKIECYDWDSDTRKKLIGECFTNINILLKGPFETNVYQLVRKKRNGDYKESGKLELRKFETEWKSSFIDYLRCGTTLHFVVGIDFSSHGINRSSMDQSGNQDQYMTAMWAIQNIFKNFERGQNVQAFGFHNEPGSVFTLGPSDSSVCSSVNELIEGYKIERRKGNRKSGRINLGPMLEQVNNSAEKHQDGRDYIVLIIITGPGRIDLPSTNESIVHASPLPMSIAIAGVGESSSGEDFKNHKKLHREPVVHGFKYEDRKIVRFVEMNEHQQTQQDWEPKFVEDLLADVPEQLVSWMRMKNLPQGTFKNS